MLLEPLLFRNGVRAHNRVWLAPLTNQQSHDDGQLSDAELHWLERRAQGGFGVVETCAAHVAKDGQGWPGELGIYADFHVVGLTRLASALHTAGALGFVQLFHGGLRADPKLTGEPPWSASAHDTPGPKAVRAATDADIERVIKQFADAARRAHSAGFDGVELHGAHGYLLSQFLSKTYNGREDQWGGDLENRARLIRETLRAVRAAAPSSFLVGVRLSPEDHGNARGLDLDESIQVSRWLVEDGADFIHLSLWHAQNNTHKRPNEHPIPLFRAALAPDVALVVAGNIWTPREAEEFLKKGASAVALGRSAIVNPDFPKHAHDPHFEPRRPPLTRKELEERALSPRFIEYMRNWKGFVSDE